MIHVAGIIRRHLENILNYLVHRITNAVTEGLNAKIQWIKYSSRGFHSWEAYETPVDAEANKLTHTDPEYTPQWPKCYLRFLGR